MKKIDIDPLGYSALVTTGTPLLAALLAKKLKILMSCGAKGICSTCHVRICSGMEQLSPMSAKERRTLSLVADSGPDSRLACQTAVYGDGVRVVVPAGMYIEKADDLLSLLGTHAPENILHPITGVILIPRGKIITRTLLEQSRSLEQEVKRLREAAGDLVHSESSQRPAFTASGVAVRPNLSNSTHFINRGVVETKPNSGVVLPRSQPGTESSGGSSGVRSVVRSPVPSDSPVAAQTRVVPVYQPSVSSSSPVLKPSDPLRLNAATAPPVSGGVAAVLAGTHIDKYLLLELVGQGGAGVVYRALHTKLKTLVAVKFLRADLGATTEAALERLAQEAQLLAKLSHPNVVRVLDFEDHPTRPYVVMEFVDGLTAADLVKQSGRVSSGRAVQIVLDVIAGLEAARKIGIIHRDVKPGNILISREGCSKLVDLGLATLTRLDLGHTNADRPIGPVEGTVGYMAPEVLTGAMGDHRADIYSLGATLFHLIAGRLPFLGRSPAEVIMKHMQLPPPVLHELVPDAPPELSGIIQTMMAKLPAERYQEYAELREDLLPLQHALVCS